MSPKHQRVLVPRATPTWNAVTSILEKWDGLQAHTRVQDIVIISARVCLLRIGAMSCRTGVLALDINGRIISGGRSYFNTNLLADAMDDSVWQAKRWTTAGGYDQKYASKQEEMLGSLTTHDMQWSTPTYSFVQGRPWIASGATTYTMPHQDSSAQNVRRLCPARIQSLLVKNESTSKVNSLDLVPMRRIASSTTKMCRTIL